MGWEKGLSVSEKTACSSSILIHFFLIFGGSDVQHHYHLLRHTHAYMLMGHKPNTKEKWNKTQGPHVSLAHGDCYGLNLECPAKAHVWKAWFPVQQCPEAGLLESGGSDVISE